MSMRYLTLITFLIIYTLVTPTRAEYQSGYNPNEEYNCRYSWGSGKIFYRDKDGKAAPLDFSKDDSDGLKEITFLFDIVFSSLVLGFLPILEFFDLIENVPNFESLIFPCFCKFSDINKKNSSIKFSEICLEKPICI